ncbi:N-terminal Xaa-Pro-Lys N-methyltransferase 1 isoform X2 [Paroedura picta]|uniref:N-terminal Xaa-Pro-Lys N-methyltransferase 1 isoform X2 n=1 Tax=Paroedura picta TaxID=143630 RepID=UPI004057C791
MTSQVVEDEPEFYSKAKKYWKDIPPTVDGMLGGYGHISSIDINSSRKFLLRFIRDGSVKTGVARALDCGAGIGRITKRLLLPLFKTVDMVDVTEDFLNKAKTYLGHLTDDDLSNFLKRCRLGLQPNGLIVIKDNMAQEGVIMDDVDSSVCRDLDVVCKIIRQAGLSLLAQEKQDNFPDEIYHVYTLAMR